MTTTTHFTAQLAEDHRRRLVDVADARRLARTARASTPGRHIFRRPELVSAPAHTLQTRCA